MSPQPSRRTFLQMATASALAAPGMAQGLPQERPLGVAIVGLGKLSSEEIAPALKMTRHCRLAAVVSGSPESSLLWQEQHGVPASHCYTYDDFDRMGDNPDIDFVYLILPNSLHAEFTLRAARAGKHVYCEKPMAISVAEGQSMIDACREAGRLLGVAYRCPFTPHHQELIRLARDEVMGPLLRVEGAYGFHLEDPRQWRLRRALAGGGAIMDVGIYAIQGMRGLVGEEPVEVQAFETKSDPVKFAEVDETVTWVMKFPGGVIGHGAATYRFEGMNYLRGFARDGWFELGPEAYGYEGISGRTSQGPLDLPQVNHFAAQLDDFAECIRHGRPTRVSGEEGLADLRVIEGIYRSIAEGRAVPIA